MASREIQLDGAEISIIKALGLGSSEVDGGELLERCKDLDVYEVIGTLKSLMEQGYVDGESEAFYSEEDLGKTKFQVNSGYAKDLRNALDPRDEPKASKRVRRE